MRQEPGRPIEIGVQKENCQLPSNNPFKHDCFVTTVPTEECGVPGADLFPSHPTCMYLPHTLLHVPQRAEGDWEESVLRLSFPSPGGTMEVGQEWSPPGEVECFWEPGKCGPNPSTASSFYLVPPNPWFMASTWCCSCRPDFDSSQHTPGGGK